ncbi:MAG: hypothetical protein C4581_09405 [Nitrospiraceae bacterium]|nr:MAG: hypothetical protein C4581_09405 [Nitrospiraceae bacterium]
MIKVKPVVFILTIIVFVGALVPYVFFDNNFLIRKWNIPLAPPGFYDARQMGMAAESYAQGYDPLIKNPLNQSGNLLNYPRIWHLLFALGINQSHTNLIGSISVFLFFIGIGLFWFSKNIDNLTCLILSIAILSSAVMLGVERGNIELILFFILSLAISTSYSSNILALFFFLIASFLKLYPIFGLVYLLKENKKKFWSLFLLTMGVFIIYLLATFVDTLRVYDTTPKLPGSSFGLNVWWMGLKSQRFFNLPMSENVILYLRVLSYAMVFLISLGALFYGLRNKDADKYASGKHLDTFRVGAGIYIGCFILINNADHRLLFLIFTIPQLVSWFYIREHGFLPVAILTLSVMFVSLWNAFIMRFLGLKLTFLLEEIANWVIFTGLLYLFISSLPDWFRSYLRRSVTKTNTLYP